MKIFIQNPYVSEMKSVEMQHDALCLNISVFKQISNQ